MLGLEAQVKRVGEARRSLTSFHETEEVFIVDDGNDPSIREWTVSLFQLVSSKIENRLSIPELLRHGIRGCRTKAA